jgi:plasmid maintenance system antidote protein VapI
MAIRADELSRQYGLVQPLRLTEGIYNQELADILNQASKSAHRIIAENALKGGQAARIAEVAKGLGPLSKEMWLNIEQVTKVGISSATELAAKQSLSYDSKLGMPQAIIKNYERGIYTRAEAGARAIVARRTHGFTLSERIYANGRVTVKQVGKIIEQHLALQTGAKELANAVRDFYSADVPGGAAYAARRLARTEINNAHHQMTIDLAQEKPWVESFVWNLSGSHPRPDECNDLVGTYNKGEVPDRPHPQCFCYLTVETVPREKFIKSLKAGDYDDYVSSED